MLNRDRISALSQAPGFKDVVGATLRHGWSLPLAFATFGLASISFDFITLNTQYVFISVMSGIGIGFIVATPKASRSIGKSLLVGFGATLIWAAPAIASGVAVQNAVGPEVQLLLIYIATYLGFVVALASLGPSLVRVYFRLPRSFPAITFARRLAFILAVGIAILAIEISILTVLQSEGLVEMVLWSGLTTSEVAGELAANALQGLLIAFGLTTGAYSVLASGDGGGPIDEP